MAGPGALDVADLGDGGVGGEDEGGGGGAEVAGPAVLETFRREASLYGVSIETTLIWPRFPVGASTSQVALRREGALLAGTEDYVKLAEASGADHLAINWELVDKHLAAVAQREGVGIMLWTPNDAALLDKLARRWPADVLITDFPGELP